MKKENFVETNEESKGTLEELIRAHNAKNDAHGALRSVIDLGLLAHKGDFDLHVSETEREAWNKAADAAKEIREAESYAKRAETAQKGAESARDSAQEYYRSAVTEKSNAATYAEKAEAAEERVKSYIDGAKSIKDNVAGFKETAERKAGEAASDSLSAKSWAYRASEAAGNAAWHANRAEDAAKKAEELAEESGRRIDDLQELIIEPLKEKVEGLGDAIGAVTSTVGGKANSGQTLASMEELEALPLPGDVSEGVIYTVVDKKPVNGCLVTGKFSDYFELFRVTESGEPAYCFKEAIANYREYMVVYESSDNVNHLGGFIFNVDGTPASGGFIGLNISSGNVVSMLDGYDKDNPDVEVSFYICPENELEFSQEERAFYYNGESWVEIVTTKHLGDIDKALDAILAMDEKLLGGDA